MRLMIEIESEIVIEMKEQKVMEISVMTLTATAIVTIVKIIVMTMIAKPGETEVKANYTTLQYLTVSTEEQ